MAAGRPTLYRDDYPAQAKRLALLGLTDAEMAEFFEVSQQTLYDWDKAHPEFLDSRARGKAHADGRVAEKLYHRALGFEQDAVKIFMPANAAAPVYAPYRERFPPDTQAASLWLSNRQGGKWKLKSSTQQLDKDGNPTDPVVPVVKVTFSDE
jgi:hypothetical protein